jgi:DNA-binding HxlR family transcriptional regulator
MDEENKKEKLPPRPTFKYVRTSPKIEKTERDKKNDEKIDKFIQKMPLDNICPNICVLLLAKKKLRFNELYRSLRKLGLDISKPTLNDHLKHLLGLKLVKRKVEDVQNVSYALSNERIFDNSKEDTSNWVKRLEKIENLVEFFDVNEEYKKLSSNQLEYEVNADLDEVLQANLLELKAVIDYDLRIDEFENDTEFWKFIGNPLYRLLEKSIAEKCRGSEIYRKKFFEKLESLVKLDSLIRKIDNEAGA